MSTFVANRTAPVLRPYQVESHDAVLEALDRDDATLLVLPTGCGKTATAAAIAATWRGRERGRILMLAHRKEIVEQNAAALERADLGVALELGDERASLHGHLFGSVDAVSGSVQSVARRLKHYQPQDFGLLILDEAHHAVLGSQYSDVRDHFASAHVLGLTATPDRLDKRGLGGIFKSIAYTFEVREAISSGYLVPIRQKLVHVDGLDFSRVRTVAGDLNEGQLDAVMREDGALHGIAEPTVRLTDGRPTLVFSVTVEHAYALAAVLEMYGGEGCAVALDGSTPDDERASQLRRFRNGEFRFLVNCGLFTEGTDLPFVSACAVARPTASRALYQQMVGRVLRLFEGKSDALVLDFAGNAGKHALITAPMVLGADVGPDLAARAAKRANETGADLQTVMDELAEIDRVAEIRRRAVQVKARIRVQDIDPFAVLGIQRHDGRTSLAPTDAMKDALVRIGLKPEDVASMDRRTAGEFLTAVSAARRDGRATFKQQRFLMSRGLRSDISFAEAGKVIDAVAQNRWQVPPDLIAKYAVPDSTSATLAASERP